jgi:beta-mannanase
MLNDVENIESETGIQLDIILEYYDLGYLPRLEMMQMIADSGRVLELTYQTSKYGAFNADYLYEVLSGTHDEAIDELINRIVMLDEPVLFRPNNEMNGDWCSYNAMYTHKDTAVYRAFWRWLHDRFEEAGAENVIWVWNPNWGDFPSAQWNSYLNYFPGEDYVDVIGLTGYNTGTYYPDETWRSFDEIYLPMLWEYNRRFSGFPYMITEFGSSATGGDKGAWIASALDMVEKMNIKAAVWWNHVDYDTSRGAISRGYKFDNDRKMLSVFRQNFKGE